MPSVEDEGIERIALEAKRAFGVRARFKLLCLKQVLNMQLKQTGPRSSGNGKKKLMSFRKAGIVVVTPLFIETSPATPFSVGSCLKELFCGGTESLLAYPC
jgi:hypothetical protein